MFYNLISMNSLVFVLLLCNFIHVTVTENVKKSVDDNREDNGETYDDGKDVSLGIAVETESANATCTRRQNSQMHEIRQATHKQFPFMAAIMSQQNEYVCSGSIVSHGLVLTTAKCAQQANYVLVNTTSDKKDDTTVPLHVIKTDKFPSYTGSESIKDVAVIYTEKHNKSVASKINLSNVSDTKGIIDLEALGFGLNADVGKAKELQYIGVELRVSEGDRSEAYIDCIDTKIPTCFKDFGGPVIVDNQLFGIITEGSSVCSKELTASYAVNKRIVEFLPTFTFKAWLDEKIRKIEEQEPMALETYPSQPAKMRKTAHVMTAAGNAGHYILAEFSFILIGAFATVG